jgi:hypothetical protein
MTQTSLGEIRDRVAEVAKGSPVADRVDAITIEADRDNEGSDFLRVVVTLRDLNTVDDDNLERLIEAVENAVGVLDHRFPSVRFAEAA